MMLYFWQCPMMFLSWALLCFVAALVAHIVSPVIVARA